MPSPWTDGPAGSSTSAALIRTGRTPSPATRHASTCPMSARRPRCFAAISLSSREPATRRRRAGPTPTARPARGTAHSAGSVDRDLTPSHGQAGGGDRRGQELSLARARARGLVPTLPSRDSVLRAPLGRGRRVLRSRLRAVQGPAPRRSPHTGSRALPLPLHAARADVRGHSVPADVPAGARVFRRGLSEAGKSRGRRAHPCARAAGPALHRSHAPLAGAPLG